MPGRVLGVTGYMASGKDTACRFLREYGVDEIDVDRLGHRVLEELLPQVEAEFGRAFVSPEGLPDRKALGRYVFAAPERLARLEALLHPEMVRRIEAALPGFAGPVALNAALLYPMGLQRLCGAVLVVEAPEELLLARAVSRGGLDREEARIRLQTQKRVNPIPETADFRIENNRSPDDLQRYVQALAQRFFGEGPYGTTGTKWPQGDVHPQPGQ